MSALPRSEAVEKLAKVTEAASCKDLADFYEELFPDRPPLSPAEADKRRAEITDYIRTQMEPEEMVDLWNVVFPADWNVWYNELEGMLVYNLEQRWYAEN